MERYKVCETKGQSYVLRYIGDDPVVAWDVFRSRTAVSKFFGNPLVSLMKWNNDGIGRWEKIVSQVYGKGE